MSANTLPKEIWTRIFGNLDVTTLSRVSRVSRTFHTWATDNWLFHQHVIARPYEDPAVLYTRQQALRHGARVYTSVHSSPRTEPIAVVRDTLVLCDFEKSRFVCFPEEKIIELHDAFDGGEPIMSNLQPLNIHKNHVILPDGHLALVLYSDYPRLVVINVATGKVSGYPLYGGVQPTREVWDGAYIVPAGYDGNWIAYYVNDNTVAFVDWRTGEFVREEPDIPQDAKLLLHECPGIQGSALLEFVIERTQCCSSGKVVQVNSLNGEDVVFGYCQYRTLECALMSADMKTLIFILFNGTKEEHTAKLFHSVAVDGDKHRERLGVLPITGPVQLEENGRVIAKKPTKTAIANLAHHEPDHESEETSNVLWFELNESGCETNTIVPTEAGALVWSRRTPDGGFAICFKRATGMFSYYRIKLLPDGASQCYRMGQWAMPGVLHFYVVADHYFVVQARSGRIKVFHFERFCRGETDAYACPGAVQSLKEEDLEIEGF